MNPTVMMSMKTKQSSRQIFVECFHYQHNVGNGNLKYLILANKVATECLSDTEFLIVII